MMRPFDWNDANEVRRLVVDLVVALEDVDAIVVDLLRPASKRELGPVLHHEVYQEARAKIAALLLWIGPANDPEPSGPSGLTH
jgi:hypothetical protein